MESGRRSRSDIAGALYEPFRQWAVGVGDRGRSAFSHGTSYHSIPFATLSKVITTECHYQTRDHEWL